LPNKRLLPAIDSQTLLYFFGKALTNAFTNNHVDKFDPR
jgi:hypothetical protein